MAWFNGYQNYQPNYQQIPYMGAQNPQNNVQQNGIIWVQGEAAAKSYLVAPGQTVQLWDSEEKVIYLKSADASGMPSMKILDYTIRGAEEMKPAEYATKEDLNELSDRITALKAEIAAKKKPKVVIREEEDDE